MQKMFSCKTPTLNPAPDKGTFISIVALCCYSLCCDFYLVIAMHFRSHIPTKLSGNISFLFGLHSTVLDVSAMNHLGIHVYVIQGIVLKYLII